MYLKPAHLASRSNRGEYVAGTEKRRSLRDGNATWLTLRTRSVFAGMARDRGRTRVGTMRWFLVEIPIPQPDPVDLKRAARTLGAAQVRLSSSRSPGPAVIAAFTDRADRLVCLIESPTIDATRRLVALALLPAGRIREVPLRLVLPDRSDAPARNPGADPGSGAEPELVEDVVDVRLDGPLGHE
jgi:hypothetical protein